MRIRGLQCGLALSCGLLAVSAQGATLEKRADRPFADADHVVYSLAAGAPRLPLKSLLTNHGGGVIAHPKVVFAFWGPSFNNAASPDFSYARTLQAYRNQLGGTALWGVLQQYGVFPANLGAGTPDWFDTSTPPIKVTDAIVQGEVNRYLASHAYDSSTIYEVVIPAASYSVSGSSTSCGGPSPAYCSYHAFTSGAAGTIVYTIQPYASCSRCQVTGWTAAQNQEHFVFHETAEAATDPRNNAWWDGTTGEECVDKCEWSPAPFLSGGYAYASVWSNAANACVSPR